MPASRPVKPGESPHEDRLQLAIQDYRAYEERYANSTDAEKKAMKKPSYRYVANKHGIDHHTTLSRRIRRKTQERREAHIHQQVLTPEEEQALVKWSQQMDAMGSVPRCSQLHSMGAEMLKLRTGSDELGSGWAYKFLERHPGVKDIYAQSPSKDKASSLDKEKMIAGFKDFASASHAPAQSPFLHSASQAPAQLPLLETQMDTTRHESASQPEYQHKE